MATAALLRPSAEDVEDAYRQVEEATAAHLTRLHPPLHLEDVEELEAAAAKAGTPAAATQLTFERDERAADRLYRTRKTLYREIQAYAEELHSDNVTSTAQPSFSRRYRPPSSGIRVDLSSARGGKGAGAGSGAGAGAGAGSRTSTLTPTSTPEHSEDEGSDASPSARPDSASVASDDVTVCVDGVTVAESSPRPGAGLSLPEVHSPPPQQPQRKLRSPLSFALSAPYAAVSPRAAPTSPRVSSPRPFADPPTAAAAVVSTSSKSSKSSKSPRSPRSTKPSVRSPQTARTGRTYPLRRLLGMSPSTTSSTRSAGAAADASARVPPTAPPTTAQAGSSRRQRNSLATMVSPSGRRSSPRRRPSTTAAAVVAAGVARSAPIGAGTNTGTGAQTRPLAQLSHSQQMRQSLRRVAAVKPRTYLPHHIPVAPWMKQKRLLAAPVSVRGVAAARTRKPTSLLWGSV